MDALRLIGCTDESAALHWPEEVQDRDKMVMPGDNVEMMCTLHNPLALENGQRFNVREGGRTVSYSLISFYQESSKPPNVVRKYRIPEGFHMTMKLMERQR